ncbi:MAG: tRNA (5-methylaminomethyl-2-thiouridine)(34)-methyltransferase MnmD [Pseudomonadota bacterium]
MNRPLTRTPAPSLDFSRPGTPAASDFGDIYFSTDGGLEETRAVFLRGCGLPDGWMGSDRFTVAELGFGSGLNFLATWQAWRESGAKGRLHYVSIEGFPFELEDLSRALSHFPELSDLAALLIEAWPGPVKGLHRRHFGPVTLTLVHDMAKPALEALDVRADAWFLDGFSPAKNPDMWDDALMAGITRLSAPGARLASFTVAGAVRRALGEAGFDVGRKAGFGRKRHRLEARLPSQARPRETPSAPTIVGAGIAGASVARAFLRRGITPDVLFDPDHVAASGNGAALVKPRFDLQDSPSARFFLSSFLYAREAYRGAVLHQGVRHLFRSEAEAARYAKLEAQAPLGPGHLVVDESGANLPTSLVIDTQAACAQALDGAQVRAGKVLRLEEIDGPVVLAGGYGIRGLLADAGFRYARGQLSWSDGAVDRPVTYGGYALPWNGRVLLGATHDRVEDHGSALELRPQDDARNLAQATDNGVKVGPEATSFRASVRVNSPDTLPRLVRFAHQRTEQDIWVLSGLGSRGFVFAPLLGEALASLYLGEPSPLDAAFARRINSFPR